MVVLSRRFVLTGSFALMAARTASASAQPVFYREAGCGCCHAWTERMASGGLPVTLADADDLARMHEEHGVPPDLRGCHVGSIDGYAISGHVPPADILRLLKERPEAAGLAVPGMPAGSPGMETGDQLDPYAVILFGKHGSRREYARYG